MAATPQSQSDDAATLVNRTPDEETPLLAGSHEQNGTAHPHPDGDLDNEQETWYSPRINTWRFASVNLSLLIMGMNDACIGVGIPVPALNAQELAHVLT